MTAETSNARGDWVLVPRELLEAAVCPMKESGCDGTQYPVQPYGEGEQCQWCYERRAALSAPQPPAEAQAQGGGEVRAWETEDGRVISARQKETALRDGGASASSVAIYSIPLYTAPPSTPVRVSWADFWIAQGDWPTANDYAAFEKAEQWLLAQQSAAVDGSMVEPAPAPDVARLAEALEEIRSRSSINLAMRPDTFVLTARLGDIYQIADAALSKENSND